VSENTTYFVPICVLIAYWSSLHRVTNENVEAVQLHGARPSRRSKSFMVSQVNDAEVVGELASMQFQMCVTAPVCLSALMNKQWPSFFK